MKKKRYIALFSLFMVLSVNTGAFAASPDADIMPTIYAQSAISIDLSTNEIIYEKNIDNTTYPASTTKLMTALLLAENKAQGDMLTYTENAKKQPEYSLNTNLFPISVGDKFTAKDAMLGLLLYSGNDVAYMIADNVSGNAENFKNKMNEEVQKLGLKNTHFVTPNGLHDKDHYTTAYDLSIIAKTAYANQWVQEAMGTKKADISTASGIKMTIENRNKLLGSNGCIGGKTGYTSEAGKCLVAVYERDGRKLLGIVMKSVYDANDTMVFNDMEKVINWSYAQKPIALYKSNAVIKTESLKYKPLVFFGPVKTIDVPVISKQDVTYYDNTVNKTEFKENYDFTALSTSAVNGGKSIGSLKVSIRDSAKTYELYSSLPKFTIFKSNFLLYLGTLVGLIAAIFAIALGIKKILDIKRKNRTYYY